MSSSCKQGYSRGGDSELTSRPSTKEPMDSYDLLEQEEAYHKLNAEIELRTRQLMKNMEAVMNKKRDSKHWPPENYIDIHGIDKEDRSNSIGRSSSADLFEMDLLDSPYSTGRSLSGGGRRGRAQPRYPKEHRKKDLSGTPLIPPCAKGMSAESLARFLKAKGKLLHEELEQSKRDLQMKTDECKRVQHELRNREEEKVKSSGEIYTLKEKVKKLELTSASLSEKLQMRDSENSLLKKEVDMLKQDLKKINLSTSGQETRLNKSKEENEKLKQSLKQIELNEKEARDKFRKKNEELQNSVRRLEKQKSELLTVIRKQVILIENLRKQKGLLETEGALNFTEKEFLKLLDGRMEDDRR